MTTMQDKLPNATILYTRVITWAASVIITIASGPHQRYTRSLDVDTSFGFIFLHLCHTSMRARSQMTTMQDKLPNATILYTRVITWAASVIITIASGPHQRYTRSLDVDTSLGYIFLHRCHTSMRTRSEMTTTQDFLPNATILYTRVITWAASVIITIASGPHQRYTRSLDVDTSHNYIFL